MKSTVLNKVTSKSLKKLIHSLPEHGSWVVKMKLKNEDVRNYSDVLDLVWDTTRVSVVAKGANAYPTFMFDEIRCITINYSLTPQEQWMEDMKQHRGISLRQHENNLSETYRLLMKISGL